jgi:signal transduction histidine kinase/CHASE3 domain sensor protein
MVTGLMSKTDKTRITRNKPDTGIGVGRLLMAGVLLLLAPIVLFALYLSIARTTKTSYESQQLNSLIDKVHQLRFQYNHTADKLDSYMFLGSEDAWLVFENNANNLMQDSEQLYDYTKDNAPEYLTYIENIEKNIRVYIKTANPIKEIRQDPRGVVAGVLTSNITQAEHHYAFIASLSEAIASLSQNEDIESIRQVRTLYNVYTLWLRSVNELRANLLLRNTESHHDLMIYAEQFSKDWSDIMANLESYDLNIQATLQEADKHQKRWIEALPEVLNMHMGKRWRVDLRYFEDNLLPITGRLLDNLNKFGSLVLSKRLLIEQQRINNQELTTIWVVALAFFIVSISFVFILVYRRLMKEQELKRTEAERVSKLKTDFLSRASHELRTPLNAILGFTQLLEMDRGKGLSSETQQEYLQEISNAGQHLLFLVNEILDLSAIESGNATLNICPVHLCETIQGTLPLVTAIAQQKNISIDLVAPEQHDMVVSADPKRLQQVLMNLITNAVKYNRQGGSIVLSCQRHGEMVRVNVQDDGIGISNDDMEKLFQPFQRLPSAGAVEGTGIGLVVSRDLIEIMGGKIGVQSTPGKGSTFWFELPFIDMIDIPGEIEQARKNVG